MSATGWLTHEDFAGRMGEQFEMTLHEGEPLSLELVEATESTEPGGRGPEGQQRLQFSLVFRGPAEPVMPQSIYALSHAAFDDLELFLVPIGPDSQGMRYEAIFA